ncbi:hypothetical protein ACFC1F_30805, partial [Kitasatospora sp. NPDC056181]
VPRRRPLTSRAVPGPGRPPPAPPRPGSRRPIQPPPLRPGPLGELGELKQLLYRLYLGAGRLPEAVECHRRAGEAGGADALRRACEVLRAAGLGAEAEQLRRYGWEPGGGAAAVWTAPVPAADGHAVPSPPSSSSSHS